MIMTRLICLLTLFFSLSQGFAYTLDIRGLTKAETDKAKALLSETFEKLPPLLQTQLVQNPVKVSFKDFSIETLGSYQNDSILLNQKVLSLDFEKIWNTHKEKLANDDNEVSTSHRNSNEIIQSALLHELAHHFDRINQYTKYDWYLEIAAFPIKGFLFNHRHNPLEKINQRVKLNSPDQYEFSSVDEHLAVNFEYYILDEEFPCRKPYTAYIFDGIFKLNKYAQRRCHLTNQFIAKNSSSNIFQVTLDKLDISRIYRVDYLIGGRGEGTESQYGHSMLRLAFCAPFRKEKNDECLKDLSYHYVLSFAGRVPPLSGAIETYWGGSTGKFLTELTIRPFLAILKDYTETQLRTLEAHPLAIPQIAYHRLLPLTLERHWTYAGPYSFLSNNCADETLNFLKSLVYENKSLTRLTTTKPYDLLSDLKSLGLIAGPPEKFNSKEHIYQNSFQTISSYRKVKNYHDYLKTKISQRRLHHPELLSIKELASEIIFERLFLERELTKVAGKIQQEKFKELGLKSKFERRDYLTNDISFYPPFYLALNTRYGVPLKEEMPIIQNQLEELEKENLEKYLSANEVNKNPLLHEARIISNKLQLLSTYLKRSL